MEKIRIAKFLAESGIASRRKAEQVILDGQVKLNGKVIKDLSCRISEQDKVEYKNKVLHYQPKIVIALNKPPGYLSTLFDPFKRKTVMDLLKNIEARVYPVGRLDYNSRGLILLSNDGNLSYYLTHPKFHMPKKYEVLVGGELEEKDIVNIKKGIKIEDRELIPLDLKILEKDKSKTLIEMTIIEGRKRIIRRTFEKIGFKVKDLKRTQIGKFNLSDIKEGNFKILNEKEIASLTQKN